MKQGDTTQVDDIMREMGLEKCKDTVIGIPGKMKGISGGEKKRLAFASEVKKPFDVRTYIVRHCHS